MTRSRRPRTTTEDRALWEAVSKTVKPLKHRPVASSEGDDADPPVNKTRKSATPTPPKSVDTSRPRTPPRLTPLDRRQLARIGKGTIAIDARVDLHGMTQARAHKRLCTFLLDSQAAGARLVLVITGKGQASDASPFGSERGVLRRSVPNWLAAPDLRPYVIGYETAGRAHGGDGALYVRIRSRRNR